ncbi:hypothetical protein VPH35_116860 [Triticum aestivum]
MAPSPLPSRITKAAAGCLSLRILGFSGVERFGSLLVVAPWGLSLTRKLGCLLFHVGFSFDKAYVRGSVVMAFTCFVIYRLVILPVGRLDIKAFDPLPYSMGLTTICYTCRGVARETGMEVVDITDKFMLEVMFIKLQLPQPQFFCCKVGERFVVTMKFHPSTQHQRRDDEAMT